MKVRWNGLFFLAFVMLAAGCGGDEEAPGSASLPPLPQSAYVDSSSAITASASDSVFAWMGPSTRGVLTTLRSARPPRGTFLSLDVLIQNGTGHPILLNPKAAFLRHEAGVRAAFRGQQWPMPADTMAFYWLGPGVYELNGEDVSRMGISSFELEPGKYAAARVSFPVPDTLSAQAAVAGIEELLLPYASEEGPAGFIALRP